MTEPVRAVLRAARSGLLFIALLSLFINLLVLVQPIFMFQVFDRVLGTGRLETLIALVVVAAFAFLVMGALDAVRSFALIRISTWLDRALGRSVIFASTEAFLAGQPVGTQALRDLHALRNFASGPTIIPIIDAPWTPIFIVIIWLMHPLLGIFALGSAVVLSAMVFLNEISTRRVVREANVRSVTMLAETEAAVRNAHVLHAMGMMPGLLRRWETTNEAILGQQIAAADRGGLLVGVSKFLRSSIQMAMMAIGAYLVVAGELTAGGMIAGSILLGRALAPVEQAMSSWKSFIDARTAYRRLSELFARIPTQEDRTELPEPQGRLTVEAVVFAPAGHRSPILKGVSFGLEPGQVLAVVGPTASGKSTLCRIMVGSWRPTSGSVRLDGAEIHTYDRDFLGRHVGYLPQEVELFDGTIKENIARLGEASDTAVIEAARTAGVHDMILRLRKGYDTQIGPNGTSLSGGQRQRIGLARALLGKPRLVVLDEPNANLDQEGEEALKRAITHLKGERAAVVLVAHRPSMLECVDDVLVMDEGSVRMSGAKDDVLPRITGPRLVHASAVAPQRDAR